MPDRCTHLQELLAAQRIIIERHLKKHLEAHHITDEQEGKVDFVETFGWIMRELYCGYICSERFQCQIACEFLPEPTNQSDPVPPDILELAKQTILKRHLSKHIKFLHIADPKDGEKDFMERFGELIQELICGFACENRYECSEARRFLAENKKIMPQS